MIDLYADESGNVSKTQSMFGVDEVERAYDYEARPRAPTSSRRDQTPQGLQDASTCDVPELPPNADFGVGGVVGGRESRLRVFVTATIVRKVVTIGRRGGGVLVRGGRRVLSPGDKGALMAAR